jgi:hypothetical protein
MKKLRLLVAIAVVHLLPALELPAQQASQPQQSEQPKQSEQSQLSKRKIPAGSKVFLAPMGGFETYLKSAMVNKKVPLEIVEQRDKADYEITGVSESKKAGAAKIIIMGSFHSREEASIKIANLKTGELVYAYSVHKENSAHGKQSTAEACAKHLKDEGVSPK